MDGQRRLTPHGVQFASRRSRRGRRIRQTTNPLIASKPGVSPAEPENRDRQTAEGAVVQRHEGVDDLVKRARAMDVDRLLESAGPRVERDAATVVAAHRTLPRDSMPWKSLD